MAVQFLSYRCKLWISSLTYLSVQLVLGSIPLLILTSLYGNTINNMVWVAIILVILLALGHESFYVIQQTNQVTYSPLPRYTTTLLMADRMSQELGAILGLWVVAKLWLDYRDNFILLFSIIWTIASCAELCVLFIYKKKKVANADVTTTATKQLLDDE